MTVPGELVELMDQRLVEEHFATYSKYFQSLGLFDLIARCPHTVTGQVVNDPQWLQDKVYAEIVKNFPEARKKQSPWVIAQIIELRKREKEEREKQNPTNEEKP